MRRREEKKEKEEKREEGRGRGRGGERRRERWMGEQMPQILQQMPPCPTFVFDFESTAMVDFYDKNHAYIS